MIIAPAGTLLISILLVILAGSLLGSIRAFAAYRPDTAPPAPTYTRPSYRTQNEMPVYKVPRIQNNEGRRMALVPVALIFVLAYVVSTGAFFTWQSAWPVTTDLRHLATAPHCSIAHALNLGNASKGMPGYFNWHDPDGNGIACEQSVQTASLPITSINRLSATPLVWPIGLPAN